MGFTVEIKLSIFVGLGMSCAMVLALREGAVRLCDALVTVCAGVSGAVIGGACVQVMPSAQSNLIVVGAAAVIVGGLAAAMGEIMAGSSMITGRKDARGPDQRKAEGRPILIDRTIIRLRDPHGSLRRAPDEQPSG